MTSPWVTKKSIQSDFIYHNQVHKTYITSLFLSSDPSKFYTLSGKLDLL